ncbi:BMP family ABC transporter substrate-binding protein [Planobispora rosea]|uniref:BMP family ABC transporter substrate-binding protein n=1 Tax=Planobispora rosea TaxID=35762 RepID=A0A8J3S9I5_PLARO|nr:BMP family ABC transporter substrate-binding protein [Planobispora rosea]GGT07994.1 BMP family ABC transporter substrate-binding protein [Planobispora rosea]GIH89175.1 BMP family ABC transporter substrate-binding protein [Planobispora rosea]
MRTRSKTALAVLAVSAVTTLAGCGAEPVVRFAAVGSDGLGLEQVRVGIAFDQGGRGDKSFNDAAAAGLDRAKKELEVDGVEVTLSEETDDERATKLRELAESGRNPVIAVGFLYAKAVQTVAAEFPDTTFAIVDDDSFSAPNVVSLVFAEEQGSYLVGAAAALKSRSGRVGFIGGVRMPLLQKFEAGFAAGAAKARPGVDVSVDYVSTPPDFSGFGSPDRAKEIAERMMADGVDVIYTAAGGSGSGSLEAIAAREGVWAVGVDSDQYQTAGPGVRDVILSSMIKRVDNAVFQEIQAFIKGDRAGGVKRFDLKTDGVGYSVSNDKAVAPVRKQVEALRQRILGGAVTVPTKP